MTIRVLALTRYDASGPSSRVRFYQFGDFLRAEGLEVQIKPLLDSVYVRRLLSGQSRSLGNMLRCYTRRDFELVRGINADVLWPGKSFSVGRQFYWIPVFLGGRPGVVNNDDVLFHSWSCSITSRRCDGSIVSTKMESPGGVWLR